MKLYQLVSIKLKENGEYGDEFNQYLGVNLDEAKKAKYQTDLAYDHMTPYDQRHTDIEFRVYEIDDDVDTTNEDALIDALIDCIGYDVMSICEVE